MGHHQQVAIPGYVWRSRAWAISRAWVGHHQGMGHQQGSHAMGMGRHQGMGHQDMGRSSSFSSVSPGHSQAHSSQPSKASHPMGRFMPRVAASGALAAALFVGPLVVVYWVYFVPLWARSCPLSKCWLGNGGIGGWENPSGIVRGRARLNIN